MSNEARKKLDMIEHDCRHLADSLATAAANVERTTRALKDAEHAKVVAIEKLHSRLLDLKRAALPSPSDVEKKT